jgi:hypothetical protein
MLSFWGFNELVFCSFGDLAEAKLKKIVNPIDNFFVPEKLMYI